VQRLTISVHACTETLALLVAVAHADGRLDDREKQGVRGAAEVLNLPKELRARLDQLLEKPADIAELKLERLSARERAFAYVASAWMARVDDLVDPKEKVLLDKIGAALELRPERRAELDRIAGTLERLPDGEPSWSKEVAALFKAIPPQVEQLVGDFEVVFE